MEWRRGHVIGRGSSATVSTATSSLSDHIFAVKSAELSQSQFLQREQNFLSILKSPHIVSYIGHDITTENEKIIYNIFMEYIPGGTLSDKIRRNGGRLNESTIVHYTRQILLGLNYLHSINVAHCDIKGENILIGEKGAKITDFGCARWQGPDDDTSAPLGGTPVFMAPEVARGEQQGFPADVWALGCTVIEMATGSVPWPDPADHVSALYKIAYSGETPEIPEYLSPEARDFLNRCFRICARERWTVKQLLDHPFLTESYNYCEKQCPEFFDFVSDFYSPTSILDQGVWNSIPESLSTCGVVEIDGGDSPSKRIGRLVSRCLVSTLSREENWVTIREMTIFR